MKNNNKKYCLISVATVLILLFASAYMNQSATAVSNAISPDIVWDFGPTINQAIDRRKKIRAVAVGILMDEKSQPNQVVDAAWMLSSVLGSTADVPLIIKWIDTPNASLASSETGWGINWPVANALSQMHGGELLPVIQSYAMEKDDKRRKLLGEVIYWGNQGHNARTSVHWKNARIIIRGMLLDVKGDEQKRLQQLLRDVEKWIKPLDDQKMKK